MPIHSLFKIGPFETAIHCFQNQPMSEIEPTGRRASATGTNGVARRCPAVQHPSDAEAVVHRPRRQPCIPLKPILLSPILIWRGRSLRLPEPLSPPPLRLPS
jgi:hypothetical protein